MVNKEVAELHVIEEDYQRWVKIVEDDIKSGKTHIECVNDCCREHAIRQLVFYKIRRSSRWN